MSQQISSCPFNIDNSFGPWARSCRGAFDFTLLFEETILAIPLLCFFILCWPLRMWQLGRTQVKVRHSPLRFYKAGASLGLVGIELALLILWAVTDSSTITHTRASLPTVTLSFVASLGLCLLSWYEHARSIRPSFIIEVYLFLSILLNLARTRTLWMLGPYRPIPILFTISIGIQFVMIILEATEKRNILKTPKETLPKEATSGTFSHSLFFWLTYLLYNGYRSLLSLHNLDPLDERLASKSLSKALQIAWDKVPDKSRPFALFNAWFSVQWTSFASAVFPRLCQTAFTFAQPFLISRAIALAVTPQTTEYNNVGYGLIGAYILVYGGIAISTGQYEWRIYSVATKMRGSVIPCIYNKTLRLDSGQCSSSTALTLISTDIETITQGIVMLHETWASLLEIALAVWLLYRQLGGACGVPVGFAIVVIIGTGFIAVPTGKQQATWIDASQKRVAATSHILGSIKSLRLSGLNEYAFSFLEKLRIKELEVSRKFRLLLGTALMLSICAPVISPVITFIAFAGIAVDSGDTLTISRAFTSLSLFALLNKPMTTVIIAIPSIAGALTSFGRIQDYLNSTERIDQRVIGSRGPPDTEVDIDKDTEKAQSFSASEEASEGKIGDLIASMQGKFFGAESEKPIIDITQWDIQRGSFTLVLGPVGCGKSTLLKALLGELPSFRGVIRTWSTDIAYCEQAAWLPNCTVKEAIIGDYDYNSLFYEKVLQICALQQDIQGWPNGDDSSIGSKGISMSGGQKQRLSIARAVYSKRKFVIFDDVFSGLDATTENEVFHNLLGREGLFRGGEITTVVASSDARRTKSADRIIIMNKDGGIEDEGTFEEVNDRAGNVFDTALNVDNTRKNDPRNTQSSKRVLMRESDPVPSSGAPAINAEADLSRQTGDSAVYKFYAKSAKLVNSLIFISSMVVFAFCDAFPSLWLKWWAEANLREPNSDLGKWLGVYAALSVGGVVSCLLGAWELFIVIITQSGLYFHSLLSKTVSRAPMSLFTLVDHGVTINRFSQDLQLIDMELPASAIGVAVALSFAIAQCVMMSIASKYIAIVFPFILMVFYFIQRFYLRTSRQMRFLDIEHKAPLYSQMMETLSGLLSIRAFGWQEAAYTTNWRLLDDSQRPNYLLYCLQRWLTLSVDLVIALLAVIMIIITTTLREQIGPGYIGVALTNVLAFGSTLKAALTSWVMLEISIGAVARIKNFASLTEPEGGVNEVLDRPGTGWPSHGLIEITNLSASYPNSGRVLKDISMTIQPGQKVAICGRTGSGKSSLALSLFRMMDIEQGSIKIDGVDISQVSHSHVRTRLVAVSQDIPVLEGSVGSTYSVRLNVDPTETFTDEQIIHALVKVQLWPSIERRGGLDASLEGNSLSQGQLQLLILARSMLRSSRVLVLDEATSSLDEHTSAIIDEVLRSWFADWTVLAIAHKLDSVLDFDMVAVLDDGHLVEFGQPRELLARDDSKFRSLYEHAKNEVTYEGGDSAEAS